MVIWASDINPSFAWMTAKLLRISPCSLGTCVFLSADSHGSEVALRAICDSKHAKLAGEISESISSPLLEGAKRVEQNKTKAIFIFISDSIALRSKVN